MSRAVILRPQAEFEIAEASAWYEERSRGLGSDFLRAVDAAVSSIQRSPEQYPQVRGSIRRALLRRFPYALLFTGNDMEVVLLACFHARRDPRRWHRRS